MTEQLEWTPTSDEMSFEASASTGTYCLTWSSYHHMWVFENYAYEHLDMAKDAAQRIHDFLLQNPTPWNDQSEGYKAGLQDALKIVSRVSVAPARVAQATHKACCEALEAKLVTLGDKPFKCPLDEGCEKSCGSYVCTH